MSAGDYIQLKKAQNLKNYKTILSSGKLVDFNYETRALHLKLDTISNSQKEIYTYYDIKIDTSCNYAENTYDGIKQVNAPMILENTDQGLNYKVCDGSFDTNTLYFDSSGTVLYSGIVENIADLSFGTQGHFLATDPYFEDPPSGNPFCVEWSGYFYCNKTGNWTFYTNTQQRDNSFFWLGTNAESGYTIGNANIALYRHPSDPTYDQWVKQFTTLFLLENTYYPIRIMYDERGYDQGFVFSFQPPTGEETSDGSKNLYYTNAQQFTPQYTPLKSIPSIPTKLQVPCYKGIKSCNTDNQRASIFVSNGHRRQWNRKKPLV